MKKLTQKALILFATALMLIACGPEYQLKQGKQDFRNLEFDAAKEHFNKSIEKRPESYEAIKMLAETYVKLDDFEAAEKAYELALNYPQVTIEDKFDYGRMLMSNNKHAKAEEMFKEYVKARPDDEVGKALLESCQFIELFQEDTALYKIEALPLLSNVSMFSPVPYDDGLVVAVERLEAGKTNPWTGNSYYDIAKISKTDDVWGGQTPLDPILNTKFHDGPIAFNKYADYAVLTRSYMPNGKKAGKDEQFFNHMWLYASELDSTSKWSAPKPLSFNGEDFGCMHPALTAQGDTIYFASDMPGGLGGLDIYRSVLVDDKWQKPVNLGPRVNTKADEAFPTIGEEGGLYFSSNGHPSLGSLDIFKTEMDDEGQWRKPRNLNYPINSTADDFSYYFSAADSTGYFASNRSGGDKVFEFIKRPSGKVFINGRTVDEAGEVMSGVTVKLIDKDTGEVIDEMVTGEDGAFDFILDPNGNYRIEAEKEGFFTQSYERSTINQFEDEEFDLTLTMPKLIITDPDNFGIGDEGVYRIDNIYYDFDKFNIRADASVELDNLVEIMRDNPDLAIELHSHTDTQGEDEYNRSLSERRAQSAKKYLVAKGIPAKMIGTKGFGETRITNRCANGIECTDEEHEENRRTEFIVTGKEK